jgi:hypothetical protein
MPAYDQSGREYHQSDLNGTQPHHLPNQEYNTKGYPDYQTTDSNHEI